MSATARVCKASDCVVMTRSDEEVKAKRLTVTLRRVDVERLQRAASREDVSPTESIRRGIQLLDLITERLDAGDEIIFKDAEGKSERTVVLVG